MNIHLKEFSTVSTEGYDKEEVDSFLDAVADELEKITAKYGLETFGQVGEEFDPQLHEALLQMPYEGEITVATIAAVMQRGVYLNGRLLRPARVGVASSE